MSGPFYQVPQPQETARNQEVSANESAVYTVTLGNDGNSPVQTRVTGPAGGAGWTVRYEAVDALILDGVDDYVDLGAWTPGNQWSVEAWVKPSALPGGRHTVVGGAAECRDWGVVLIDGKFAVSARQPGGCSTTYKATAVVEPGVWYHVAATGDGSTASLYINGELKATGPSDNYIPTAAGTRIGGEACCSGGVFPGTIREVSIWSRALAAGEVAAGLSGPVDPAAEGLAGYWRLADGAGGSARDLGPSRRHGLLMNDPVWQRRDITDQVTGAGWEDNLLAAGGGTELRVVVTPDATVADGTVRDVALTAAAKADPARTDTVRMVTTARVRGTTPVDALFTTTADFERGWMSGTEAWSVRDQLQLDPAGGALPYLWVPNSSDNSVSKIDSRDGRELARYRVAPSGVNGNPSRTTVDLRGNCWVANRNSATVVKIGLRESGGFADRNGDGIVQTSRDANGDGVISGSEILDFGKDECVLHEVLLVSGSEARYVPGAYRGAYPNNYWSPGPRGMAVDSRGNLWAGTHDTMRYYYIDGESGQILRTIDLSAANHMAYGAAIDARGILWSSGYKESGAQNLLRLDPADGSVLAIPLDFHSYGLALDRNDHLFVSANQEALLTRWNTLTGTREWTVSIGANGRGVAVTEDGDVWVVSSGAKTVSRYSNNGVLKATIGAGSGPTGVAVDAAGKMWAMGDGDEYLRRIDPATDSVDLVRRVAGSHYGYSDMTGILARNSTVRLGIWSAVHDGQVANTAWDRVRWHAVEPVGTGLAVRARSSNDRTAWSAWETCANGIPLGLTPPGRYLELEVTLRGASGAVAPTLQDIGATGRAPAPADLGLILRAVPNPVPSEYPQACFVVVTNRSENWASGVRVTNRFPAISDVLSVSVPGGSYQKTGNEVVCTIGGVAPLSQVIIVFGTEPNRPGTGTLEATVLANETDPNPADNAASLVLTSQPVPCVEPPAGLVAWWAGEGNGLDSAGTNHLAVRGGPTFAPGKSAQGFVFDSNDDGLAAAHNDRFNPTRDGFTAQFWMRGTQEQPGQQDSLVTLLEKSHGWVDNSGWAFQAYPANGALSFGCGYGGGTGNGFVGADSLVSVLDGRWHHIAGTWDGYSMRLYVDGALQATTPLVIPAVNNRPVNLGFTWGNGSPRRFFRGQLDEVMIADRRFDEFEIVDAYNARSGGHCRTSPFLSRPSVVREAIVGREVLEDFETILGQAPYHYLLAAGKLPPGLSVDPAGKLVGRPTEAGNYSFTIRSVDAAGVSAERGYDQLVRACVPLPAGLVGRWTADELAEDLGRTNHGVLEYNAGYAPGRVGKAFVLDGNDDAVRLPGSSTGALDLTGNQVSIVTWINIAAINPPALGTQQIFDKYWDGSATGYQLVLNQGRLEFAVATAANRSFAITGVECPLRQWVHVAGTYDGTTARLYVDGTERAAAPLSGNIVHNGHDATIGNDNWPGSRQYAVDGLIDEVEVYARGLDAAEVRAIHDAGAAGRCVSPWADLLVKNASEPEAAYSGGNVYQGLPDGNQARAQSVPPQGVAVYDIRIENDSPETRTYALKTVEDLASDWTVVYRDGSREISRLIRDTAGWTTAALAPGAAQVVRVEVSPGLSVPASAIKTVAVTAYRDGAAPIARDALQLVTTCQAHFQPDLMIRRENDDGFAGEGIFNASGAGQSRLVEVAPAEPATFLVQLKNHGNASDRIRLDASSVGPGWSAAFCGGRPYLEFDGVNQFVRLANTAALRPANLTLEGWYNFSVVGGTRVLFSKALGGGTDDSYVMWHDAGALRAHVSGVGQIAYAWSPVVGTWYHLAYVFDDAGNRHALYVNGVEVASGAANASIPYDDHPPQLGADYNGPNPSEFFAGRMADVRLWGVARSAAQIQANRGRRLAGTEAGLAGYWRLDDGEDTTARDATAGANHGQLFNGPAWGAADGTGDDCFDLGAGPGGPGGLTLTLGAKATYGLRVQLTPDAGLPTDATRDWTLSATSLGEPAAVDRVVATASVAAPGTAPRGGTYTSDRDFDRGRMSGLEYTTVADQLQLATHSSTLRYLWVPNNEGTISKLDTLTGHELARYRTCPVGVNGQPSRTTVDLLGNCYVANRYAGTVVKVGLFENGQYVDRNGDGLIRTSADANNDHDIAADEMVPWGQDECVLWEVSVVPGYEGTYTPGTYTGPYRNSWGDPGPRGIAVDAKGNLWLGTLDTKKLYYLDGQTGTILRTIDVSSVNHRTYGAVLDRKGILWASSHDRNEVLRFDPSTGGFSVIPLGHFSYGINVDREGHVFVSGWNSARMTRIDPATSAIEWSIPDVTEGRGMAITDDGDVWVAHSGPGVVVRRSNSGVLKATIPAGNQPSGVSVDSRGMIWCMGVGDAIVRRIDPTRNVVDLQKTLPAAYNEGYHYGYSDMTGMVARNSTTRIGLWSVVHDSGWHNTPWGSVAWHAAEPAGASVRIRVRSSNDRGVWSLWEDARNGVPFHATPPGRYLEVEATLQSASPDATPVLYDVAVKPAREADYGLLVYANDFEGPVGPEWSANPTGTTPAGGRRFLGEFGNQTVTLTLGNLPPHVAATVMVDQYVIRTWDGNSATDGPDLWELNVAGGLKLVHATFNNGPAASVAAGQSFPGTHPGPVNPPRTGAMENDTLGFVAPGAGVMDSVYAHVLGFPHTASTMVLNFAGTGLSGDLADESWGLDNVRVFVVLSGNPPELVPLGWTAEGFKVRSSVEPGWSYTLEASTDLQHWETLHVERPSGTVMDYVDPATPGMTYRFYRVRKEP
ncbi:MAG: hypothetical protein DVB31_10850 [Verrucomicrobia bacterium]|nr:MAG: hypothetical protein DVB31_10850 [Verrucomicrobiota bacterium]